MPISKMTRSLDSISWPFIGPDQCNGYKFSYRVLPTGARSTLYSVDNAIMQVSFFAIAKIRY